MKTLALALAVLAIGIGSTTAEDKQPRVVTPGDSAGAPSDAIVLFDGDASGWTKMDGGAIHWVVADGALETRKGGSIRTKQEFGDVQLHIEWATPTSDAKGQGRGNSGVYLQGRFEVQVLDSYQSETYPNGQAGAFYGNFAPLVNASRPQTKWQTYEIVFHAPKNDGTAGSLTVFHNGVLIQDHVPVKTTTTASAFSGVSEKGPLVLQDHGNPVRFRNIWIREL
jgi:hypothetical protein